MKEFVLVFRMIDNPDFNDPAQMKDRMNSWMNWMGGIAARDQLVSGGNRLGVKNSKVVCPGNVVVDGPYTEMKEFINGYIIVRAEDVNGAVEIAKECPIVMGGGKVEVRPAVAADNNE